MKTRFLVCLFLLAGIFAEGFAQTNRSNQDPNDIREQQQYNIAQRYLRNSQYESAIALLQRLYEGRSGDMRYYGGLLDAYLNMRMYDEATALVNRQIAAHPGNPNYLIDAGNVRFKAGDAAAAREIWANLLKEQENNITIFTLMAAVYVENRLFDEAEALYHTAIKKFPQQTFMLRELADFYRQRLQYQPAMTYYLRYLEKEPQNYQHIARSILSFELEEAQINSLSDILQDAIKRSNEVQVQLLASKFYQKHQRYEPALALLEKLENDKTAGRYLDEFASTARSDSAFALALRAYNRIVERFPQSQTVFTAYLGAAHCNLALAKQTGDQKYARQAIDMIQRVSKEYPKNANLGSLRLLEGDVYREFFFDLDRAISIYNEVAGEYANNSRIRDEATLKSGETQIMRGNLDRAESQLNSVGEGGSLGRAQYLLARIAIYRHDFTTAREQIGALLMREGITGDNVNDALALQTLLVNESLAPEALKHYVTADWLLFQQKKNEAITQLEKALDSKPPAHFRVKILIKMAHLAEAIGKYPEALEYCNLVVQDEELHLYADEAVFIMAGIMDKRLGDIPKAFALYDQLLSDFPDSQFAIEARSRLRQLRAQYPDLVQ